jgi:hypothetical protein
VRGWASFNISYIKSAVTFLLAWAFAAVGFKVKVSAIRCIGAQGLSGRDDSSHCRRGHRPIADKVPLVTIWHVVFNVSQRIRNGSYSISGGVQLSTP